MCGNLELIKLEIHLWNVYSDHLTKHRTSLSFEILFEILLTRQWWFTINDLSDLIDFKIFTMTCYVFCLKTRIFKNKPADLFKLKLIYIYLKKQNKIIFWISSLLCEACLSKPCFRNHKFQDNDRSTSTSAGSMVCYGSHNLTNVNSTHILV